MFDYPRVSLIPHVFCPISNDVPVPARFIAATLAQRFAAQIALAVPPGGGGDFAPRGAKMETSGDSSHVLLPFQWRKC
jgi:hypothetical protein